MNEDKQRTCDALTIALATKRQFDDLLRLEYVKNGDYDVVIPHFRGGKGMPINVHLDSCWALIKDVVNHLEG